MSQKSDLHQDASVPTAPTKVERWFPIAAWLPRYNWGRSLGPDMIAAISVAALLIPESMGYSSVAGVPVQIGLYAAPLALIGYAMFGGSKLLVFGAAGSVAAVSAGVVGGLSGGDQTTAVVLTAALALATGAVFIFALPRYARHHASIWPRYSILQPGRPIGSQVWSPSLDWATIFSARFLTTPWYLRRRSMNVPTMPIAKKM